MPLYCPSKSISFIVISKNICNIKMFIFSKPQLTLQKGMSYFLCPTSEWHQYLGLDANLGAAIFGRKLKE
jgi:hypothetical protein